jgi:hypothetical protein
MPELWDERRPGRPKRSEDRSAEYRKTVRIARGERGGSANLSDLAFDADEAIPPRELKPER